METEASKECLSDSTIEFVVYKSSKDYPATLRRVVYLDEEQGREFMFLTNNFELPASVIAELYHNRWNIELFFKWLKQHLKSRSSGVRVKMLSEYKSTVP